MLDKRYRKRRGLPSRRFSISEQEYIAVMQKEQNAVEVCLFQRKQAEPSAHHRVGGFRLPGKRMGVDSFLRRPRKSRFCKQVRANPFPFPLLRAGTIFISSKERSSIFMLNISPRSAAIVASFFVIASAVSGCASEENEQKAFSFTDDNGEDVTVSPNGDGTETATYADGRSVTFQRGDDGSMTAVGGTAALLGGLAAGYLLARGFSGGAGYFDSSRGAYRVTTPYAYERDKDTGYSGGHFGGNGISRSRASQDAPSADSKAASGTEAKAATNNSAGNTGTSVGSTKTAGGFGGAGARSAAS